MSEDANTAEPDGASAAIARFRATLCAPGTRDEIADEDVRGITMPVFANRLHSLREMLEGSLRFADRTFVVQGGIRLDFGAHLRRVDALAAAMQNDFGIRPGDRVAIHAANRWEWIVAFWAATSAGAVPCAFNGYWTANEVGHALDLTEPALLVGDGPRLERVGESGRLVQAVSTDEHLPGVFEEYDGRRPEATDVDEDDPAALIFTSGTTGRPKAVTATHRAIIGFAQLNTFNDAMAAVATGAPVPQRGEPIPSSDAVILVTSPLFHTSMLYGGVVMSMVKGSEIVLLPGRFDPDRVLETIERERVTMWMALGSAAPRVCASPFLAHHDTSSVQTIAVGGAPVSPSVQDALREAFPSTSGKVGMGYTSTEAGAVVANIGGPEFVAHPTSTGRITVTTQVELRDDTGRCVAPGELGDAVCAVVVTTLGSAPTVEELEAWCRSTLAAYKIPTRWYLTEQALPRTPSGKLVKNRIRDQIAGAEQG